MIRLNFQTWDKKLTLKYSMNRIWIGGVWTPLIKVQLRQRVIDFR